MSAQRSAGWPANSVNPAYSRASRRVLMRCGWAKVYMRGVDGPVWSSSEYARDQVQRSLVSSARAAGVCQASMPSGQSRSAPVISRDWRIANRPCAKPHSTSCGKPKCASMRRPISQSSRTRSSERASRRRSSSGTATSRLPPPSSPRTTMRRLSRMSFSRIARVRFSTRCWSGSTRPATTASPRPQLLFRSSSSGFEVIGFAVKSTPATSEENICCTTTAIHTGSSRKPWRSR